MHDTIQDIQAFDVVRSAVTSTAKRLNLGGMVWVFRVHDPLLAEVDGGGPRIETAASECFQ